MNILCKTEKGTLEAWTWGNTWREYNKEADRGISIGRYGGHAFAIAECNNGTMKLTIKKQVLEEDGIELIIEEKEEE